MLVVVVVVVVVKLLAAVLVDFVAVEAVAVAECVEFVAVAVVAAAVVAAAVVVVETVLVVLVAGSEGVCLLTQKQTVPEGLDRPDGALQQRPSLWYAERVFRLLLIQAVGRQPG